MRLDGLKPKIKRKTKKRVGRGGKRGTYSGRGIKGQRARAGHKIRPALRDAIKKIPKLRGYRVKVRPRNSVALNIGILNGRFADGAKITPRELAKNGIIKSSGKFFPRVKILGSGEVSKKFFISGFRISKSAKEKIEKAGGIIT